MAVKAVKGAPTVTVPEDGENPWDDGIMSLRGITVYGAPEDRNFMSWVWLFSERDWNIADQWDAPTWA